MFKNQINLIEKRKIIVKKLKFLLPIISLFLLISSNIHAQRRNVSTKTLPKEVIDEENFKSILSFGLTTNTNSGLLGGLMIRKEFMIDNNSFHRQFHYFNLEIVNVNHYRESSYTPSSGTGNSYTLGKLNYLFAIRPQYGREINIFRKSSEGGVNINAILAGGPTLGILKPYFVQINYGRGGLRDEAFNPAKHITNTNVVGSGIAGSGGFFEGLGDSQIVPGVNLKAALNFELDAFRQSNISLEIGFLAEAYTKQINIMALTENRSMFTSGYITVFFGGKK